MVIIQFALHYIFAAVNSPVRLSPTQTQLGRRVVRRKSYNLPQMEILPIQLSPDGSRSVLLRRLRRYTG